MIRLILFALGGYLLPFVAYQLGIILLRLFGNERDKGVPWLLLSLIGIVFALISVVSFVQTDGGNPDWDYHPSTYVDGKLVPGYFTAPDGTIHPDD